MDAANCDPRPVGVVVERGYQQLGGAVDVDRRCRNSLTIAVEQRTQIGPEIVGREPGAAFPGDGVDHRKIELLGIGGKIEKEVLGQLDTSSGARGRAVDLVDHHDRAQTDFRAPVAARCVFAASVLRRRRPAAGNHRPY